MHLPQSNQLPVNLLAACFNNTSATYKYYWLLSILQEVEEGNLILPKRILFARMISNAWFTVNYFHVSFGKQDLIQDTVKFLHQWEKISIDEKQHSVFHKLSDSKFKETEKLLWHFNKNVPHWFLSPWFPGKEKMEIYLLSNSFTEKCLYSLLEDRIEINPEWKEYLILNSGVLKDFCYWNLALFLQAKNPNVPDIPNKVIKPAIRSSLTAQRTKFWDVVLNELGSVNCIYTGKNLTVGNYAVEHFIPYNFVSHDLIWNLIPADTAFNSSKSDKLPPLEKYFMPFYEMQKTAIEIVSEKSPNNKLLEDYLTIFPDFKSFTKENFKDRIQPLISIAANNGFEYMTIP
jgi:hypothetical protein